MSNSSSSPGAANFAATAILDFADPGVKLVVASIQASTVPLGSVAAVHGYISNNMRAVYSIDDTRPASKTLRLNKGSCAERMVCLEALARGLGVATRVRALWLDKSFWYSRLPLLRNHLPAKTMMPWPQFYIHDRWVDFDEIYSPLLVLAAHPAYDHPFTNAGESLFDAVRHTPVDLLGKLKDTPYNKFDISKFVIEEAGFCDSRDELYESIGEQNSFLGRMVFNVLYGGRPIQRDAD